MFLNDIGNSPKTTFKKINHHLKLNYGFKISENIEEKDLISIVEQIEEEVEELKLQGDDSKNSPEISKRLLILEGIKNLKESAMFTFQSPDFEKVISALADFAHGTFCISGTCEDDFNNSIKDAMGYYRSSKYRFPDEMVEARIRECVLDRLMPNRRNNDTAVLPVIDEDDKKSAFDRELERLNQLRRTQGIADHDRLQPAFPDYTKHLPDLKDKPDTIIPDLPLEPPPPTKIDRSGKVYKEDSTDLDDGYAEEDETDKILSNILSHDYEGKPLDETDVVPMARSARSGKFVPSNMYENKKINKGKVMKEKHNLVRNLRRLLETQVSQAEIITSAKDFAEELQEMIEKIGRLQNEDLPPVTDQMRETFGSDSASAFQTEIYGALQGVMDALYTAKNQVDESVTRMAETGSFTATTDMERPMGEPGAAGPADLDNVAAELGAEAGAAAGEEAGAEAGAELEEPVGRAKKLESLESKVQEMRRLVEKAKRLKRV